MDIKMLMNYRCLKLRPEDGNELICYNLYEMSLSNDHDFKDRFFYTHDDISKHLGTMNLNLLNNKNFGFGYCNVAVQDEVVNALDDVQRANLVLTEMKYKSNLLEGIINFLWFIKDNSVSHNFSVGYINGMPQTLSMLSNNKHHFTCKCEEKDDIEFSKDDLVEALKIGIAYGKIAKNHAVIKDQLTEPLSYQTQKVLQVTSNDKSYDDYNRIERACMFLSLARSQYHLPYRIALFMPIFESLFSTESEDVNYKVSQRVAAYIGVTPKEKRGICKDIKAAYNIRSRFIHGDKLNKSSKSKKVTITKETMLKTSAFVDDLARRLLTKVIMNDSYIFLNEDGLNDFYNDLIFGKVLKDNEDDK